MLYTAYRSYSDAPTQELLWLQCQAFKGWIHVYPDSIVYTVPESYAYMLVLVDSSIKRYPKLDHID